MNKSPKEDLPWELIAESLTGSLSADGELQLQQWISSGVENKGKYLKIEELWKAGMEDYLLYKGADAEVSWKTLHAKIVKTDPQPVNSGVIQVQFDQRKKILRNLLAVAAVIIGLVGIGLWFILPRNNPIIYETAFNVQKRITLVDGSVVTMQPNTRLEVPASYNNSGRTIIMGAGKAFFDVVHDSGKPFAVELGSTQITDIGTSFTIHKKMNSIDVSVSAGKIAFIKLSTRETKELRAGSAITFDVKSERFGVVKTDDSMNFDRQLLNFKNTPLSDIIVSIGKVYGKEIIIDRGISDKTFTGQLDGMTYSNVIKVICQSLGLEYSINDSIYTLKAKTIEQP